MDSSRTLPNALLRAFEKEEHALSFIRGEVRTGLLSSYRQFEDARRDETEGIVSGVWKGLQNPVHFERLTGNNYYILCTSHPNTDRRLLAERFGQYLIRIREPLELLKRIEAAWQAHSLASPSLSGSRGIVPVVYDKHTELDATPALLPPISYSYSQKPKKFDEEREFRYVLACTADVLKLRNAAGRGLVLDKHVTLELHDCSDICSLL